MPNQNRTLRPAPHPKFKYLVTEQGAHIHPPADWACLKPGDAAVTRALKALGPCWTVQQKKGRKIFSLGVWAPAERIEEAKKAVEEKRADPAYAKRRESDLKRRAKKQAEYEKEFYQAVLDWLHFHPKHQALAEQMAKAITEHAVPVGSGTVARTEQIPVEKRASAAVIAWMRHQTTAYDTMYIERVKGRRREVRRELAKQSAELLGAYRKGQPAHESCPLAKAVRSSMT
ncbi:DUF2293 domain-containing protein [Tichowtungia aerotolerans]|uniref:DUF2293 domain-containing protein n=1 Tax=Tichowtungia aerotolerans TaxID=2697043 RepID=A0A6P1MC85_9BACT|nr:DUF2293 domain-containing protein [Tichowtungia aerotolerans]QHI70713.1 DUF2293 domain-containing protein [Tichowtungia aerotolerans]